MSRLAILIGSRSFPSSSMLLSTRSLLMSNHSVTKASFAIGTLKARRLSNLIPFSSSENSSGIIVASLSSRYILDVLVSLIWHFIVLQGSTEMDFIPITNRLFKSATERKVNNQ